jgi:2Fe-2S ferredoxin
MPTLTFEPAHLTVDCSEGESVFDVARRHGVPVATSCAGRGSCGLCRIRVVAGEDALSAFTPIERKHLGNVYFITRERLSCQARLTGTAATVDVPLSRLG